MKTRPNAQKKEGHTRNQSNYRIMLRNIEQAVSETFEIKKKTKKGIKYHQKTER